LPAVFLYLSENTGWGGLAKRLSHFYIRVSILSLLTGLTNFRLVLFQWYQTPILLRLS
jgi:hypothetical protein